jgi:hypothetical protein
LLLSRHRQSIYSPSYSSSFSTLLSYSPSSHVASHSPSYSSRLALSSSPPTSPSTSYSLRRIVLLPNVSVALRTALTTSRSSPIYWPCLTRQHTRRVLRAIVLAASSHLHLPHRRLLVASFSPTSLVSATCSAMLLRHEVTLCPCAGYAECGSIYRCMLCRYNE